MEKGNGALQITDRKELSIANEFNREQIDLIKQTVANGTTDNELKLFLYTAKRTGLDPLLKQIHAVKRWSKKDNRDVMSIQTGIDGYRLIADRTGAYAGNDDYEFDSEENPTTAKARVWKIVNGIRCPFEATARWSQYYPGDAQGFMWKKMPHVMLGKCAEALALRKAFPAEMAGVYTAEEMAQAGQIHEEQAPVQHFPPEPQGEQKPAEAIETAVIVATDVKHFKTKNSEFYKVMDTEGALYRTFDKKQAAIAKETVGSKTKLRIHYKVHPQYGPNLVNLEPVYEDAQHVELLREVAQDDEYVGHD